MTTPDECTHPEWHDPWWHDVGRDGHEGIIRDENRLQILPSAVIERVRKLQRHLLDIRSTLEEHDGQNWPILADVIITTIDKVQEAGD